jgi:hypothetical protein
MPRKLPPPHPRGKPRTPGSGRRRGTPNRKTVELRALMGVLAGDVDYQRRLISDFRRRRVHPTIEALVWAHVVGKPTDRVQLSADLRMNQRLDREVELFSRLSVEQMEEIAVESQALVDRLIALTSANALTLDVLAPTSASVDEGEPSDASQRTSDDADRVDDRDGLLSRNRVNALKAPIPVDVSQHLPEGIDEAARRAPSGHSTAPTVSNQRGASARQTPLPEDGP